MANPPKGSMVTVVYPDGECMRLGLVDTKQVLRAARHAGQSGVADLIVGGAL